MVVCCLCGVIIEPNDVMMCDTCLRVETAYDTQQSIDAIEKEVVQCPKCMQWKRDSVSEHYFAAEWESVELLTHLTKRVRRLKELDIVDAKFVWTEPHSKRIKVQLISSHDVLGRTKLTQSVELEFRIRDKLCKGCTKLSAKDGWSSIVQVRQHTDSVDVLLRLEKDIQKAGMHMNATQIGSSGSGLDLTFNEDKYAHEFVRFVRGRVPCEYHHSRKVVSTDIKSGNHNIKYTHLITVAPINVHDVVVLPPKIAAGVGGAGRLALCVGVTSQLAFVDIVENSFQHFVVTPQQYFRDPFTAVLVPKQLTRFVVLDVEMSDTPFLKASKHQPVRHQKPNIGGKAKGSKKKREKRRKAQLLAQAAGTSEPVEVAEPEPEFKFAEAEVAREVDLGENDDTFHVRTHVGDKLEVGEIIYGYNLDSKLSMLSDELGLSEHEIPSIVLVKGEDIPDPKKRKNRAYRGKKQNFNGGRPLKSSTTKQAESVPPVAETEEAAAPDTATLPSAQ